MQFAIHPWGETGSSSVGSEGPVCTAEKNCVGSVRVCPAGRLSRLQSRSVSADASP